LAEELAIMRIAVIHGPNLQLLGKREPEVYGSDSLETVNEALEVLAVELAVTLETIQSNYEGEIINFVSEVAGRVDGFLINPGGLTHTSVVLRDALVGVERPFVEVHLSNTAGVVFGFGLQSYLLGLQGLVRLLSDV
jgi:3-dehydroquinate dehydratase-2